MTSDDGFFQWDTSPRYIASGLSIAGYPQACATFPGMTRLADICRQRGNTLKERVPFIGRHGAQNIRRHPPQALGIQPTDFQIFRPQK